MDQAVRYSVQDRIKVVWAYFATRAVVKFHREMPGRNVRTRLTIKRLLDKFTQTGSVQDNIKGRSGRPRSVRTENHIHTVKQCLRAVSKEIRNTFAQETHLSRSLVCAECTRIYTCFRMRYNFRPMQMRLRNVSLRKPPVSDSRTILTSWASFFQ